MKACNTDMYHFLQVVAGVDKNFAVLSGEDSLFPLHVAAGARGGIVVTANLLPKAWRQIFDAASAGRTAEALAIHRRLIPLMNMAFAETNPGPMKAVMDMIGVDAPRMLAPLVAPAPALVAKLRTELAAQLAISEGISAEPVAGRSIGCVGDDIVDPECRGGAPSARAGGFRAFCSNISIAAPKMSFRSGITAARSTISS